MGELGSSGMREWNGELLPHQASYDMELHEIQDTFHEIVVHILSRERSSTVKRTLLMVRLPLLNLFSLCRLNGNFSALSARTRISLGCAYFLEGTKQRPHFCCI